MVQRLLIGDLVIVRRSLVEMDHHGVPRFRLGLGLSLPVFRWTLSPRFLVEL